MEHGAVVPGEEHPVSWEPLGADTLPKGLNLFSLLPKARVIAQLFQLICLLTLTLCLPACNS